MRHQIELKRLITTLTAAFAAAQVVIFATPTLAEMPKVQAKTEQSNKEQPQKVDFIAPEELKTRIANNTPVTIVDVRGPTVYAQSDKTVQGAIHTKVRRVVHRLKDVSRDSEVVTYCSCPADEAAIIAARSLMTNGFKKVRVLKGGWNAWLEVGGQVRPRAK
jgi:rhodanese-related sulfurtransferase